MILPYVQIPVFRMNDGLYANSRKILSYASRMEFNSIVCTCSVSIIIENSIKRELSTIMWLLEHKAL